MLSWPFTSNCKLLQLEDVDLESVPKENSSCDSDRNRCFCRNCGSGRSSGSNRSCGFDCSCDFDRNCGSTRNCCSVRNCCSARNRRSARNCGSVRNCGSATTLAASCSGTADTSEPRMSGAEWGLGIPSRSDPVMTRILMSQSDQCGLTAQESQLTVVKPKKYCATHVIKEWSVRCDPFSCALLHAACLHNPKSAMRLHN